MDEKVTYLGDGVYIKKGRWDGELIIYTSDGVTESNHIYLDETVSASLFTLLRLEKEG